MLNKKINTIENIKAAYKIKPLLYLTKFCGKYAINILICQYYLFDTTA
jgi:hypothetical protein